MAVCYIGFIYPEKCCKCGKEILCGIHIDGKIYCLACGREIIYGR